MALHSKDAPLSKKMQPLPHLSQIDHACRNPRLVAQWYATLTGVESEEITADLFRIRLDGTEIHFPLRALAGVSADDIGIDQLHLAFEEPMDAIQQRCRENGIDFEMTQFAGPLPVLFTTDPEGGPVIVESYARDD